MLDVLFVVAPMNHAVSRLASQVLGIPPLGVGYLTSVLRVSGFLVGCVDLTARNTTPADLKQLMMTENPRIVGITASTLSANNLLRLARFCKKMNPDVVVICGGPHVTFEDVSTLELEPSIDIVVRGEAENTMLELSQHIIRGWSELGDIRGITYRKDNAILRTPARPLVGNLDELPFPARDIFPVENYTTPYALIASRGCPGRCIFCSAAAMSGGKYRIRSWQNVVSEVVYIKSLMKKPSLLYFTDDTLTADPTRVDKICGAMIDMKLNLRWTAESRADVMTFDMMQTMVRAGCAGLQFGVESGSQKILDAIRKNISRQQVIDAVRMAHGLGLIPSCSFIIGLPGETEEDVRSTIDFALMMQTEFGAKPIFSVATPLPGTYMYNHADEYNMVIHTDNWDDYHFFNPVFSTPELSRQSMKNLHYEAVSRLMANMSDRVRAGFGNRGQQALEILSSVAESRSVSGQAEAIHGTRKI